MRRPLVVTLLAAAALPLLLAGCGGEAGSGPDMRPGENCLACHGFSAAGTVFEASGAGAGGVTVEFITGSNTVRASVVTSGSGNFHVSGGLPSGYAIKLVRGAATPRVMSAPPSGACNSCHAAGGQGHILAP